MSIADGYPGLEAPITVNGVALNARPWATTGHVKLDRITGGYSLAEIEDQRTTRGGEAGEDPLPTTRIGRTIVYEARVRARTLAGLRQTHRALRQAVRERSAEQRFVLDGDPDWEFYARVMQCDSDDEQFTGNTHVWPFQRRVTLGLRLSDPRVYTVAEESTGAANGAGATVTNQGITDTLPRIELAAIAAGTDLIVTRPGYTLRFDDLPAGAVVLNFKGRSVTVDGIDVSGHLNVAASNWWDENAEGIPPGAHVVSVDGGGWAIYWKHADE
jgi:hypothetical protein